MIARLYNCVAGAGRRVIAFLSSPIRCCIRIIDTLNEHTGTAVTWVSTLLVLVICAEVYLREVHGQAYTGLSELQWHLVAVVFLMGAAYTLKHDRHVRVDIIYASRSRVYQAWINLLGCLIFLLPFCALVVVESQSFIEYAWHIKQTSSDPGGLPARVAVKSVIPLGFVYLFLQGIAIAGKSLLTIAGLDESEDKESDATDEAVSV